MPRSSVTAPAVPSYRSGAVARIVGMPVATLRVWEQRYGAVRPVAAPSGHRLYSPADLQRVRLLRRLTGLGHAIGSIATLDTARLQALVDADPGAAPDPGTDPAPATAPLRLVVIGRTFASRLQRPAVALRLARPPQVVAAFDTPSDAARAASGTGVDLLVWHEPALQAGVPAALEAARASWRARALAVVYRFSGTAARQSLAATGAAVVREPADDEALAAWLASFEAAPRPQAPGSARDRVGAEAGRSDAGDARDGARPGGASATGADAVPPRRFDDAALAAFAALPPGMACECPRHVAELLMQLAGFEAYSAACAHRSPADAALHADLQRVAGLARASFESALERVARHEGLALP